MQDNVRIEVNQEDLDRLTQKYGEKLLNRVSSSMLHYTKKTEGAAKDIITRKGHRDRGDLIESIKPRVKPYSKGFIKGEVNAGEEYARFIHEGAKHVGGKVTPHFVPFITRQGKDTGLWKWAERHGKLKKRQKNKKTRWYFIDSNGNEHAINQQRGGLMVYQKPTKFFSDPFERHLKQDFIKEMDRIIKEV